jgi:hypothetical protein
MRYPFKIKHGYNGIATYTQWAGMPTPVLAITCEHSDELLILDAPELPYTAIDFPDWVYSQCNVTSEAELHTLIVKYKAEFAAWKRPGDPRLSGRNLFAATLHHVDSRAALHVYGQERGWNYFLDNWAPSQALEACNALFGSEVNEVWGDFSEGNE